MCKKLYFLISFVLVLSLAYTGYGDTTPPDPDPMTWDIEPYARPQGSIAMKATTATDINDPPVEYYFECTTDGDANSEWQDDPCYIAYNLSPATEYTFRVKARDSNAPPPQNETDWSDPCSTTTPLIMLDFDDPCDPCSAAVPDGNNFVTSTELKFTGFTVAQSGSEVSSGVIVGIGGSILSRRRADPNGMWSPKPPDPNAWYWRRCYEDIYRDFISGEYPSGITITLWGLGASRECDITIYAFDYASASDEANRIANWTANDANLLTTEFNGGTTGTGVPGYARVPGLYPGDDDEEMYAFTGTATADAKFGRIILESTIDPCSLEGQPFAFVNALVVTLYGDFDPVKYAYCPVPVDEQEGVPIDGDLSWIPAGAFTPTHDIYLSTDETAVTDANRDVNLGVLVSKDYTTTTYDWDAYIKMGETYYWRVDEVNDPLDPNSPYKGEVWSFTARDHLVAENFNQYGDGDDLRDVWVEVWPAEVDLITTTPVRDGNSMEYRYRNNNSPYYATADADIADLGMDPDWLSAGAKALSLWFYGPTTNPVDEKMYFELKDGDNPAHTGVVPYDGDMNDVKKEEWQEWNIDVALFDACDVNLANVSTITIRFGEPGDTSGSDGTVYFEDIKLYPSRCVLAKRSDTLAKLDFAPGGEVPGDCIVDYQEIEAMGNTWLSQDAVSDTNYPGTVGLVAYYPFDDFSVDPNGVYSTLNCAPSPHPNSVAILSDRDPCNTIQLPTNEEPVTVKTPGAIVDQYTHEFDGNCVHFEGQGGERISCGHWNLLPDSNELTLAIWAKWAGPHLDRQKCQGLISKRLGWEQDKVFFMFECDTVPGPRGSISLRQRDGDYSVYSPGGILDSFIGQWVHLAAAVSPNYPDPNFLVTLYLNGIPVVENGPFRYGCSDALAMEIELTIGQISDVNEQGVESFMGDLDEAYIFNRTLGPNEIAWLADLGSIDPDPNDGLLQVPVPSNAEVYEEEDVGQRIINLKDFAVVTDEANAWLRKEYWP